MRPDQIHSLDLEQVLGLLRKSRVSASVKQSFDFYLACLERINSLIIERNSKATKLDFIRILTELSFYRPKEDKSAEKWRKE